MKAPAFWWPGRPTLAAIALAPIGMVYGAIAARRMKRAGADATVPVICVGNLVAGGAGKTPTALWIAATLAAMGRKPVFLSRGYGGALAGPLSVDIARSTAFEVGDEPLLLARQAPTIVSRDRIAGAAMAARMGADVLIMDDGLQNPSLRKDLAIAVVDGEAGIGNGLCIPAGPLRAPLAGQWPLVDAVLIIGAGGAGERVAMEAANAGKPVFHARLTPDAAVSATLRGKRVLAFAGIGRPKKFFDSLRDLGAEVVACRSFADHAPVAALEASSLLREAAIADLVPVTTEKDLARMQGRTELAALRNASAVLPIRLQPEAAPDLRDLIAQVRRSDGVSGVL